MTLNNKLAAALVVSSALMTLPALAVREGLEEFTIPKPSASLNFKHQDITEDLPGAAGEIETRKVGEGWVPQGFTQTVGARTVTWMWSENGRTFGPPSFTNEEYRLFFKGAIYGEPRFDSKQIGNVRLPMIEFSTVSEPVGSVTFIGHIEGELMTTGVYADGWQCYALQK